MPQLIKFVCDIVQEIQDLSVAAVIGREMHNAISRSVVNAAMNRVTTANRRVAALRADEEERLEAGMVEQVQISKATDPIERMVLVRGDFSDVFLLKGLNDRLLGATLYVAERERDGKVTGLMIPDILFVALTVIGPLPMMITFDTNGTVEQTRSASGATTTRNFRARPERKSTIEGVLTIGENEASMTFKSDLNQIYAVSHNPCQSFSTNMMSMFVGLGAKIAGPRGAYRTLVQIPHMNEFHSVLEMIKGGTVIQASLLRYSEMRDVSSARTLPDQFREVMSRNKD